MGLIYPLGKRTGACYIITAKYYLTRWAEASPVKYYTTVIAVNLLFENVVTRFGYPKILLSDKGTHFVNKMIADLTMEFQIQHKKITLYHS